MANYYISLILLAVLVLAVSCYLYLRHKKKESAQEPQTEPFPNPSFEPAKPSPEEDMITITSVSGQKIYITEET